jgi:hypothetical protein
MSMSQNLPVRPPKIWLAIGFCGAFQQKNVKYESPAQRAVNKYA